MSVPVSQYEALRAEMRDLRQKTQQVQQLATQVICNTSTQDEAVGNEKDQLGQQPLIMTSHIDHKLQEEDGRTNMSVSSEPVTYSSTDKAQALYNGTWPDARNMWRSDPCNIGPETESLSEQDHRSVMSFASSSGGAPLERIHEQNSVGGSGSSGHQNQQLEAKVDMVYSLLTMLGDQDHTDMGDTLLALSSSPHSCQAMRQAGCIPLLVQLVISDRDAETRNKASQALHNLIYSHSDEKTQKRERRVLKLLDNTRIFIEGIKEHRSKKLTTSDEVYEAQVQMAANLMKLSFEESYRRAISQLGGIHIIARLVETEHALNGNSTNEANITMLRYACMSLINLTFGESGNKTLLCSFRDFMRHLVLQLQSENDELRQVTASVLRNLSWRADGSSKEILREVGTVSGLMKAAIIKTNRENTLKSILSALWNLSGHSIENKSEICAVDGALGFLVDMLLPEKSPAIIENAGGILRNISNQIAMREDYREILRAHNCLQILVDQLKCSSLTIVSNACGTLWNLSAKNTKDQETLRRIRAPEMLVILTKSKHKTIATASTAALKNLDSSRLGVKMFTPLDSTAKNMDLPALPSLIARKQKANLLAAEIDQNISETFENIERDSPTRNTASKVFNDLPFRQRQHLKSPDCERLVSDFTALAISTTSGGSISLPYAVNSPNTFSLDTNPNPIEKPPDQSTESTSPVFGIYTETDLDQPTDYSLRYAEDDSDSETCDKLEKEFPPDDTLKTYCTEGTPYDNTPFNFSTATSMSDLTKLPKSQTNVAKVDLKEKPRELSVASTSKESAITLSSDGGNKTSANAEKVVSQFSSGLLSPEKPINYCEEGTPGYFSRVSSFGSLNDAEKLLPVQEDIQDGQTSEPVSRLPEVIANEGKIKEEETLKYNKTTTATVESKVVKFESAVNYAEETPLMYSRSSSLASLDSVEQHSIHDDRSSIISDFSRLTSGIVSPSELPDSPTQTVPPSPRPRKFIASGLTGSKYGAPRNISSGAQSASSSKQIISTVNLSSPPLQKSSGIFEDKLIKFKEESTPIQFSTATSLSSLTVDDQVPIDGDIKDQHNLDLSNNSSGCIEKHDKVQEKIENTSNINEQFESDDDDHILENCINIGMQKNRHSTSVVDIPIQKIFATCSPRPSSTGIPIPKSATTTRYIKPDSSKDSIRKWQPPRPDNSANNANTSTAQGGDVMHTYCTEDTPAILSNACSNSDLSVLSMNTADKSQTPATSKPGYLSDESSNLSDGGQNDSLLADCIRDGMAARQAKTMPKAGGDPPNIHINTTPDQLYVNVADLKAVKVEYSSDDSSNLSGDDNLLADCIRAGQQRSVVRASIDIGAKESSMQATSTPIKPFSIREVNHDTSGAAESRALNENESLSSLSLESSGSDDALLEQCILSGMTKTKEKPVGVATKHFNNFNAPAKPTIDKAAGKYSSSHSKNGSAASVAYQITQVNTEKTIAADENSEKINTHLVAILTPDSRPIHPNPTDVKLLDKCSPIGDNSSIKPQKNGYKINSYLCQLEPTVNFTKEPLLLNCIDEPPHMGVIVNYANVCVDEDDGFDSCDGGTSSRQDKSSLTNTSEMNTVKSNTTIYHTIRSDSISPPKLSATVDNRMLDPDAMIESLDRFTAELVSQSCHLHNKDLYTSTNTETRSSIDSTWHDDNSPNDTTFPSISGSAPNVITFDSDQRPNDSKINCRENVESMPNDFPTITMTESTLIQMEAAKMANVFQDAMANSFTSVNSLELDKILPPSQMNSMMADFSMTKSPQLQRKKSLPNSIILRRALSHRSTNGQIHDQKSSSTNNLDQLPVENNLQNIDFESSMLSVASLSSEVVDLKPEFLMNEAVNPIFHNKFTIQCSSSVNSVTDLEHINPPSLFNEPISDSLADINTEFEDCCTHVGQTENDISVTEFSDANSVTPIQSDLSSASDDSISKKTKTLTKQLTPRQRRNLTKERYKTYTIAAEMILSDGAKSSAASDVPLTNTESTTSPRPGRLSARERRQNDPERFQTQTVQQPVLDAIAQSSLTTDRLQSMVKVPDVVPKSRICVFRKDNSRDRSETNFVQPQPSAINEDIDPELKYRTYNKRLRKYPVMVNTEEEQKNNDQEKATTTSKAKILKPNSSIERESEDAPEDESQGKGIRGKRKPLYSKPNSSVLGNKPTIRNIKTVSSNLVKNVTSTLKSTVQINPTPNRNMAPQRNANPTYTINKSLSLANKVSPIRLPMANGTMDKPPVMERQGTFTKTEILKPSCASATSAPKSRIARVIQQPSITSKVSTPATVAKPPIKTTKSANTSPRRTFDRSLSANGRDKILSAPPNSIRTSNSVQSLRSASTRVASATKIPSNASNPNSGSAPSPSPTKQITSKIASLWRKVEESKKQTPTGYKRPDKRIWLEGAGSSTSETKPSANGTANNSNGILMRSRTFEGSEAAQQKRVSRLGSFAVADSQDGDDLSSASDVF